MINLDYIGKHCTEKGYIPLGKSRKKKLKTTVDFDLCQQHGLPFQCINRFILEWPLRQDMITEVSMCTMLQLFSIKVVAFTMNQGNNLVFCDLKPRGRNVCNVTTKHQFICQSCVFNSYEVENLRCRQIYVRDCLTYANL